MTTGNDRLSDYILRYDNQKQAAKTEALAILARAKALAEEISSRIDTALNFKGNASENEWIFVHPCGQSRVTISADEDGKVAISHGETSLTVKTLEEGLTPMIFTLHQWLELAAVIIIPQIVCSLVGKGASSLIDRDINRYCRASEMIKKLNSDAIR